MIDFKELLIRCPRIGSMPTLDLQGKWLDEIGFTVGTSVSISYQDSCLTLCTNPTTTNNFSVLQVISKRVRHRPRTHLIIDYFLLKKYGFKVGDKVGLTLSPNMIQINKINTFTTVA